MNAKVDYWYVGSTTGIEHKSTAYLDYASGRPTIRTGTDKYTGEGLVLWWDRDKGRWVDASIHARDSERN
jgi:hypothetical protein